MTIRKLIVPKVAGLVRYGFARTAMSGKITKTLWRQIGAKVHLSTVSIKIYGTLYVNGVVRQWSTYHFSTLIMLG